MSRAYAYLISLLFCAAVLSPIRMPFRDGTRVDSFPLSWYPMFRGVRPALERPTYMIGIGAKGHRYKLNYKYWARGGMNQARPQLRKISTNKELREQTCEKIATKLGRAQEGWRSRIVEVQIVRGTFSRDEYFSDKKKLPRKEHIFVSCPVQREEP